MGETKSEEVQHWEVKAVKFSEDTPLFREGMFSEAGQFVAIRPCAEEYGGKTYLGLYLGDIAIGGGLRYEKEEKTVRVERGHYNPAIFIFDTKTVVLGIESWWGVITKEDQLKSITDLDIENVWYVKALKQLQEKQEQGSNEG